MRVEPIAPYLGPLEKSVTVSKPPAEAFRIFTEEIARWWPLDRGHSINGERARSCGFDPYPGGELYEVDDAGRRCRWGRVVVWNPPTRVAFTWHPGDEGEERAGDVEVSFLPEGSGTRVRLVHSGWQKLGEKGAETRSGYDKGWGTVLGTHYVAAVDGSSAREESA